MSKKKPCKVVLEFYGKGDVIYKFTVVVYAGQAGIEHNVTSFKLKKKFLRKFDTVENAVEEATSKLFNHDESRVWAYHYSRSKSKGGIDNLIMVYRIDMRTVDARDLVINDISEFKEIDWEYTLSHQ